MPLLWQFPEKTFVYNEIRHQLIDHLRHHITLYQRDNSSSDFRIAIPTSLAKLNKFHFRNLDFSCYKAEFSEGTNFSQLTSTKRPDFCSDGYFLNFKPIQSGPATDQPRWKYTDIVAQCLKNLLHRKINKINLPR